MVRALHSHPKAVRTMGVGKVILCSHGPSRIACNENGPCCGTIAYFVGGEKRGEELVQYNLSQTLLIWEDYLVVFVYPGICIASYPEICHVGGKKLKNSWSCWNFRYAHLLEVGLMKILALPWICIHSPPCRTPCRLFVHAVFFGTFRPSPSCVKWTWTISALLTNESSEIAMVMGLQHVHVWSGLERPWPLHFKHSRWWKRRSQSKFASHSARGTNGACMWMQDGCEVYMASNGLCFMVTWTIF